MAIAEIQAGQVMDILAPRPSKVGTKVLFKTLELEVFRLDIPAAEKTPTHKTHGAIVVQCLEGHTKISALGKTQPLLPGQLLYLPADEPLALQAVEDASLLVTVVFSGARPACDQST